ncbi:hypothetical protein JCM6882_005320 [Rhodosporidiobolus microsporus]
MASSFEASLPQPPNDPSVPFPYPIARPDPSAVPVPVKDLTPEQEAKLDKLVAHFNRPDWSPPNQLKVLKAQHTKETGGGSRFGGLFGRATPLTSEEIADVRPLNDVEKCYWSKQAFLRCLRAVKWDYAAGVRRAEETLVWRREFKVEEMKESDISREGETGKELVMGFDVNCRPVLYMHPNRQNTQVGPDQIAFVVWCLERTLDLLPPTDPAVEMLCLCIDFGKDDKNAKSQPTTLGQARKVLEILQTYYCERLGKAVCVNIPQIFFAFYKLVGPFVDPVTKDKIRFLDKPDATSLIPPSQLQTIFGGDVNMEYDHEKYFPALTKLCFERKAANLERWKKFGNGACGVDEAIIRGARVPGGVSESEEAGKGKAVAAQEADVEGAQPAEEAVAESGVAPAPAYDPATAQEPPAEKLAAVSLADENGGSSSGSTAVVEEVATPADEKFVDAPVASKEAVAEAVPAVQNGAVEAK